MEANGQITMWSAMRYFFGGGNVAAGNSKFECLPWMVAFLVTAIGLATLGGCTRKKVEEEFLLRVRGLSITPSEFNQAVKAAGEDILPGDSSAEPSVLNDLCMRVLTQITEEMMISAYAADQGIQVSDEELDKAVADIKADYPDNTFEETLLENAISFQFWRKQLAARLLVEKVITKELVLPVQITSEDIAEYVKSNYPDGLTEDQKSDDFNQKIIKHLRQQKAETAYKQWIDGLRNRYPVEINRPVWDRMAAGGT
jgi:FKBP-type peptidyl-prolyl cis-trans isomerase (trigger factor)